MLAALSTAAAAGEAQDRLFARNVLDGVAVGDSVVYGFSSNADPGAGPGSPAAEGSVELAVRAAADGSREAVLAIEKAGRAQRYDPFSASAGNPVFLAFMEEVVRTMAEATAGSPFYIRNRLREALSAQDRIEPIEMELDGAPVAAERLTFRPFAEDANRERMGPYADLELAFVLSDAAPGGFVSLEAVGAGGKPAGLPAMRYDHLQEGE
jgi:hypothetical protein